jgi:hypothetical protein
MSWAERAALSVESTHSTPLELNLYSLPKPERNGASTVGLATGPLSTTLGEQTDSAGRRNRSCLVQWTHLHHAHALTVLTEIIALSEALG